jgi:hypothetical protein
MLFLNPLLLWGLLAASLPVVIHLLNKRRHKPIQWAAMQFLLKATRESRGKKKLRHMLILACRVLAIAALALAAAHLHSRASFVYFLIISIKFYFLQYFSSQISCS